MAKHAALMLWTDAWVADTYHLSRSERGTYMDLLILMWRTPGCRVPNDNEWLGRKLRMTIPEVETELRPLITEFCTSDGNYITQRRLAKEFLWAQKTRKVQSDRAKLRWNKEKNICQGNAAPHDTGNASVTVSVTVPKEESKRESRASRARSPQTLLPENWMPREQPTSPFGQQELAKMRDWANAKAIRRADWEAQWRNWLRKSNEFSANRGNSYGRGRSVLEAADRLIGQLEANGAGTYVPGSEGPLLLGQDRPAGVDSEVCSASPRLVSSR
jgi:uncharacterized protein YdaU (DUF1376 family)